jgi:hypothetical protein
MMTEDKNYYLKIIQPYQALDIPFDLLGDFVREKMVCCSLTWRFFVRTYLACVNTLSQ